MSESPVTVTADPSDPGRGVLLREPRTGHHAGPLRPGKERLEGVGAGHDADQALAVENGQCADPTFEQRPRRVHERRVGEEP